MSKLKVVSLIAAVPALVMFCGVSNALENSETENTVVLEAISDFEAAGSESPLWYVDQERSSLAVDAEKFKKKFARVQAVFNGQQGDYQITLTSLVETDGESEYKVGVNDGLLATVSNPESATDFNAVDHEIGNARLKQGDIISIQFNSATNGKIPEGDSTAYSRGRWTKLTLECTSCE